jgi:drug/metabolite transporter (DMT)-like permease
LDAAANLFFLLASRQGLLSLAAVITALYPATTVALAIVFLHERPSRAQQVGLGLAAVAIVADHALTGIGDFAAQRNQTSAD